MSRFKLAAQLGLLLLISSFWSTPAGIRKAEDSGGREIDPRCEILATKRNGPFVILSDGRLMTVEGNSAYFSADDGRTWRESGPILSDHDPKIEREWRVLLRSRGGAIILVFMDMSTYRWRWDAETNQPAEDVAMQVWAVRSLEEGKTWPDRQVLSTHYCGALIDILQTRQGRIVVPVMWLLRDPGRHGIVTYFSDDEGRTWKHSNLIDLGGHGHHDGAMEPTLVELRDGRLWMLIRTNCGRFWEAFSEDQGKSWRTIRPSAIDASSAPGHLIRLSSGRLVLAWNQLYPEGTSPEEWSQRPGAIRGGQYSEVPASWHREELSIAFSEDERTWSKPKVIVRQKSASLSYPYIFERRPGEIWISTHYATEYRDGKWRTVDGIRLRLKEADFIE